MPTQKNYKKRPLEFFGQDTSHEPREVPSSWLQGTGDTRLYCPYESNKECIKITKTPPVQVIGCCVAGLPDPSSRGNFEAVIICPKRFYEKDKVFHDIANFFFSSGISSGLITELRLYSELGTPAPHDRAIDWTLVAFDSTGNVVDYVAIELQATATGSTGPIVPARNDFFSCDRSLFNDSYGYGTNITMSSKTILEQILHKTPLFSSWGRKFVLVIQDTFLRHLRSKYNFQHFSEAKLEDSFFVFSYGLDKIDYGFKLTLEERISCPQNLVDLCILPNPEILNQCGIDESQFVSKFSTRSSRSI